MQKRQNTVSVLFMIFSILFCVCLITANILETKQIQVLSVSLTGGLIVSLFLISSTTAYAKFGDIPKLVCSFGLALP